MAENEKKTRTVTMEIDEGLYLELHDAAIRAGMHGGAKAFILKAAQREAARRDMDQEIMTQCSFCRAAYVAGRMLSEEKWEDGGWYEWIDVYGKTGKARIKRDGGDDHFYPNPDGMKEEDIMGFRPIE